MILLVGFIVATTAAQGLAQEAEGRPGENGFKIGAGRLHLRGAGDLHYVLNPGRLSPSYPESGQGDLVLAVGPGLDLKVPSEVLAIDFTAEGTYRGYLGIQQENDAGLSSFVGSGDLRLKINERGNYTVSIFDNAVRSDEPGNQITGRTIKHVYNTVGLDLEAKPGGGALIIKPAYSFFFDFYDRSNAQAVASPERLDNLRHRPRLNVMWKFLPKTSVYLDGGGQFTSYPSGGAENPGSMDVDASLGAAGYITTKLSARLEGGWGASFTAETHHTVVAEAELGYDFSEVTKLKLGYNRGVAPVTAYGSVTNDRVSFSFEAHVGNLARLNAKGSYNHAQFGQPASAQLPRERVDSTVDAALSVDFQILSWLAFSIGDELGFQQGAQAPPASPPAGYRASDPSFVRNDVFLRVKGEY